MTCAMSSDSWKEASRRRHRGVGDGDGSAPRNAHSYDMLSYVQALILALLCSIIFVEAVPSMRPVKKAMRNSLVRFGKRADPVGSDDVFLGESYGPADSYEYVPERSSNRASNVLFY